MPQTKKRYEERVKEIAMRSAQMRALCVHSQFQGGQFITNASERAAAIDSAASDMPLFESLTPEHRKEIATGMASAVVEYEKIHGELPRDEMLASAHRAMENILIGSADPNQSTDANLMFESLGVSMSTSEGVETRAKMIGLVLPTILATATNDAITYVPGANDEIEIFKVFRTAASNFGDYTRGQVLDQSATGQYSQMKQRYKLPKEKQPDGNKKDFKFVSSQDLKHKQKIPMKKGSVFVYFNRKAVANDLENPGRLYGEIKVGEDTVAIINSAIDYVSGDIEFSTVKALPEGSEITVRFEIDIENSPELIPVIDHEMTSKKLRPSQAAMASESTIQTIFKVQREFGIDAKALNLTSLRDVMANEKSIRHLNDMMFAVQHHQSFNVYTPVGQDWRLHRALLQDKFMGISSLLLKLTQTSGMRGAYVGTQLCTLLKTLGREYFEITPNYTQLPKVHYVGKLFGMYRIYEVPDNTVEELSPWQALCYGRGKSHSEAGYIAGDAIPPVHYDHPIGANLKSRDTIWELSYGDIHPFDGENYFVLLTVTDKKPEELTTAGKPESEVA
ncbi:hypothetical protein L4174_023840 (plasmid) [Photobacterium sp. CCB-ST2H9]|uniref:hypothetical protein n=1 Tax=Photobacterium sp. CCB-ST2H9 TaxID=2912855 RepID=UPI002005EA68|nr:hypothetical protein [Photobacterium sp. CCB-ST2H9]UTM60419.1 hypothetical protein L4174_023840 [Photobacterium sp. CCB-ST2H9]